MVHACTAVPPSAGDGLQYNVVWNGSLFTSALREGDLLVVPQGLLHSLLNPTCGDVEVLALYNSPAPVKEAAVPALLAMPPAKGGPARAASGWPSGAARAAAPRRQPAALGLACGPRCPLA